MSETERRKEEEMLGTAANSPVFIPLDGTIEARPARLY
jgi:hypothetical protein